ncbi:MAG: protein kinase [bacterium]
MRRVCQGVAFAHAHQVVHRDLKPANVLIGGHGEVALVDLGLARQLTPDASDLADVAEARLLTQADGRVTRVGSVIGTPYYMSPEQAMGLQDLVGPASDVYGLGAILYHVLTGRPPFAGTQVNEVLAKVRRGNPTPPSQVSPDVPPALDRAVLQALSMDPGQRPASAMALADTLQAFQESARLAEEHAGWAAGCATRARTLCASHIEATSRIDALLGRLAQATEETRAAEPAARGAALGPVLQQLQVASDRADVVLAEATRLGRLAAAAGDFSASDRLADRLVDRFRRARSAGDAGAQRLFRRLLAVVDPRRAEGVGAGAALVVRTAPPAVPARVWIGGELLHGGSTPVRLPGVPAGSGVVELRVDPQPIRVPFVIRRGEPIALEVDVDAAPAGFATIPAGPFIYGATRPDDDAPRPASPTWAPSPSPSTRSPARNGAISLRIWRAAGGGRRRPAATALGQRPPPLRPARRRRPGSVPPAPSRHRHHPGRRPGLRALAQPARRPALPPALQRRVGEGHAGGRRARLALGDRPIRAARPPASRPSPTWMPSRTMCPSMGSAPPPRGSSSGRSPGRTRAPLRARPLPGVPDRWRPLRPAALPRSPPALAAAGLPPRDRPSPGAPQRPGAPAHLGAAARPQPARLTASLGFPRRPLRIPRHPPRRRPIGRGWP